MECKSKHIATSIAETSFVKYTLCNYFYQHYIDIV